MVLAEPQAFLIIAAATLVISLLSTLIYKFATDQKKMGEIKARLKDLQAQMREARNDQSKMLEINGKIMKSHNEYSMQSMRSMLFTIVPVMLIFIYLQGHVAFDPLSPGEDFALILDYADQEAIGEAMVGVPEGFSVENRTPYNKSGFLGFGRTVGERVEIASEADAGEYLLTFSYENESLNRSFIVTEGRDYASQSVGYRGSFLRSAAIDYGGLRILNVSWLPGWLQGWLAMYIILTLIFTNVFRRIFKVH